jgi:hypothetical protein
VFVVRFFIHVFFLCTTEEGKLNKLRISKMGKAVWACAVLLLMLVSLDLSAQQSVESVDSEASAEASAEAQPAKKLSFSNKWRMEVSGNAHSDGTIVLRFTPKKGEPVTTETAISKKAGENDVAKLLVKSLKAQLDKKQFHIERDDGEDVLVKKKMGKEDFAFEIVSNDVKNVRLNLDKE